MITREQWLNNLVTILRNDFAEIKAPLPKKLNITCSWPTKGALSKKKRTLGQHFPPECSANGNHEIFISPSMDEIIQVSHVTVHELVHAAVYPFQGHKGEFKRVAILIGLVGKMTSTTAGEPLTLTLKKYARKLGKYPHHAVDLSQEKKQPTRLLKVACQECGCPVRMTQKWLDEVGPPQCGCGGVMEQVESK